MKSTRDGVGDCFILVLKNILCYCSLSLALSAVVVALFIVLMVIVIIKKHKFNPNTSDTQKLSIRMR